MPPPTMSIPNPYLDLKTGIFKIFHLAIFQTYWGRLVGVRVSCELSTSSARLEGFSLIKTEQRNNEGWAAPFQF